MKTRIIHTKFWKDSWVGELSPTEKLLYIYLLTNDKVNIIHLYECSDREIMFDTGVNTEQLEKAKRHFEETGKIHFKQGFIYIRNACKYESYVGSSNELAKEKLLKELNKTIFKWYEKLHLSDRGVHTPQTGTIIHNTEVISNNTKPISNKAEEEKEKIRKRLKGFSKEVK